MFQPPLMFGLRATFSSAVFLAVACSGSDASEDDASTTELASTGSTTTSPSTTGTSNTTDSSNSTGSSSTAADTWTSTSFGASTEGTGSGGTNDTEGTPAALGCDTVTPSAVLFVNFDGVTLMPGMENAQTDTTPLVTDPEVIEPYSGDRELVFDTIRERFAAYNILFVDERPPGTYDMLVVGNADALDFLGGTIFAIATTSDCQGDRRSITIVRFHDDEVTTALEGASVASLGLGLEPVEGSADEIMAWGIYRDPEQTFTSVGYPSFMDGTFFCSHSTWSGDPDLQSSHDELLGRYGACPR